MRTTTTNRTDDLARRNALIEAHRSYATALAREIAETLPRRVRIDGFDELEANAMAGLVEAADRFRPDSGASFTTFAYYRIRGMVWDGIRKSTWLPPALRRKARQEASFCELAAAERNRTPEEAFRDAVRNAGAVIIATDLVHDDRHGALEPSGCDPESTEERAEQLRKVNRAVEGLPAAQRELVDLIVRQNLSQTEIAYDRGVDKSTIHRQWHATIRALRSSLAVERE